MCLLKVQTGFRILRADDLHDANQWLQLWKAWPKREPFAHPAYVQAFCEGDQEAVCAVQSSDRGTILLPLILRHLPDHLAVSDGELRDATTPYGYGGAFYFGEVDAEGFWNDFDAWATQSKIVSLFARLSLFPDSIVPFRGESRYVMDNIVRSCDLDEESMWMDYEQKVRKNVNKSTRSEVTVEWDPAGSRLKDFQGIYASTMLRREAASGFFFPDGFFEHLLSKCPECLTFAHALKAGRVISTELVLLGADCAYSFLGGTDENSFDLRPNDLLKHEIIRWCREHQKRFFVLGGGLAPDDGLLRYKSSFAPKDGRRPFSVGQRIYDEVANESLLSLRRAISPLWEPSPAYFPAYRSP